MVLTGSRADVLRVLVFEAGLACCGESLVGEGVCDVAESLALQISQNVGFDYAVSAARSRPHVALAVCLANGS